MAGDTQEDSSREECLGFTLIEVMFAGFVLSIAVLGMLSLVTIGHGVSRDAWETTLAKNAVLDKLEEIKSFAQNDFYAVRDTYDGEPGEFDVPPLPPPAGEDDPANGTIRVAETVAGNPSLLDVEVTVSWWGVGGERDLFFERD